MPTNISWTEETWNPTIGCTRVSPGCDGCYAIRQARIRESNPNPKIAAAYEGVVHRDEQGGLDWTGRVNQVAHRLDAPLRWRKPRRVFVDSMSDLFHDAVTDSYIAKVFAVMAATPHHTYQVLTKRHGRMRSLLSVPTAFVDTMLDYLAEFPGGQQLIDQQHVPWPLPNVWLGVSVENQQWANTRIPALLDTPAAVRWLSCEPLLGPVDLSTWLPPISPMRPEAAPRRWSDWTWPEWVPLPVRDAVEGFWHESVGRGPWAWMRDMEMQGAPPFGATVTMDNGFGPNPPQVTGRYVHAWNNIGRLALGGDEFAYTSFSPRTGSENRSLHWVVVGGESGPRARPMHPAWARSLREQCAAAGVPFHFKQWGEWGPAPWTVRVCDPMTRWQGTEAELEAAKADAEARGATHVYSIDAHEHGHALYEPVAKPWSVERVDPLDPWRAPIRRWGVNRAGRELDGVIHDAYPAVVDQ